MIFMILLYFSFLILIIFLDLKFREFQAGLKESISELDDCFRPFSVSEYLNKLEETDLEIKQMEEGVDRTMILWWGVDGLRMNEDGNIEWTSRRKPEPVPDGVFYQPCQSIQTANLPMPDAQHKGTNWHFDGTEREFTNAGGVGCTEHGDNQPNSTAPNAGICEVSTIYTISACVTVDAMLLQLGTFLWGKMIWRKLKLN